ncbi:DUF1593 domain-containing protein [Tuanshanicoccus lijuaniae]|uniref:DUF1593 domain-containing protein n=1 Tax=Aerococcaceae bacterium zg-1292 TaxID=2774330 RepID=UPI0019355E37|nr:DUF1593 domain-containing protein [Aerococcaceae bacterium zg-1292]QQA36348.1 DUF1593 domain-containing protein [Aerococcaceae bacterium zg-1292]
MKTKLRTVVTTDGEIDDINSFIRLLMYTNDMEVAGIILTSSMFHYSGNDEKPPFRWTGTTWIPEMISQYEKIYNNLINHDIEYPSADKLRSVYHIGNITDVGEMDKVTEGSDFLANLILDDDLRPLYIQTWGGTNTTARALKTIQERYEQTSHWEAIKAKVEAKVVLYMILEQDSTYKDYIASNWNLTVLSDDMNFGYFSYGWKNLDTQRKVLLKSQWQLKHIVGKGALLDKYALIGDGHYLQGELDSEQFGQEYYLITHPDYQRYDFISEGDSPSYFYLLHTALRGYEHPSFGGWGGRFLRKNHQVYHNRAYDYNPLTKRFEVEYTFVRWIRAIQADFAARAKWCTTDKYSQVNHYPVVSDIEDKCVSAGKTVILKAQAKDLNNLPLVYKWWCYEEVSTYWDFSRIQMIEEKRVFGGLEFVMSIHSDTLEKDWALDMEGIDTSTVKINIPEDAKSGDTFHIIFEVSNQCDTPLTSYRRIILTVE